MGQWVHAQVGHFGLDNLQVEQRSCVWFVKLGVSSVGVSSLLLIGMRCRLSKMRRSPTPSESSIWLASSTLRPRMNFVASCLVEATVTRPMLVCAKLPPESERSFRISCSLCGENVVPNWRHAAWECPRFADCRPRIPQETWAWRFGWPQQGDSLPVARARLEFLGSVRAALRAHFGFHPDAGA